MPWLILCLVETEHERSAVRVRKCNHLCKHMVTRIIAYSVTFIDPSIGAVAGLVGIRVGVVSGVINLESSGVEASDWRLRHDQAYHEA